MYRSRLTLRHKENIVKMLKQLNQYRQPGVESLIKGFNHSLKTFNYWVTLAFTFNR